MPDSVAFAEQLSFPVDRFVLTYVLDLMPPKAIDGFMQVFKSKARSEDARVCVVNLTYGVDSISRVITNIWQLLYVTIGGQYVGGCKPFDATGYFGSKKFPRMHLENVVSTGLPSQVLVCAVGK